MDDGVRKVGKAVSGQCNRERIPYKWLLYLFFVKTTTERIKRSEIGVQVGNYTTYVYISSGINPHKILFGNPVPTSNVGRFAFFGVWGTLFFVSNIQVLQQMKFILISSSSIQGQNNFVQNIIFFKLPIILIYWWSDKDTGKKRTEGENKHTGMITEEVLIIVQQTCNSCNASLYPTCIFWNRYVVSVGGGLGRCFMVVNSRYAPGIIPPLSSWSYTRWNLSFFLLFAVNRLFYLGCW